MPRALGVGLFAVLLGAATLLSASQAAAREDTTIFKLEYEVPPGCPSEVTFRSQVRARTSKVDFSDGAASSPRVSVRIAKVESGFLGRLSLETAPGELAAREVEAPSCDEVVAALALTTALNVDPDAGERERVVTPTVSSHRWSLGGQFALSGAPSSFPAPRVAAFADWFAPLSGWTMGGRALIAYGFGSEGSQERGRTSLGLWNARLSFCPVGKRWAVEASLCALGELGVLNARGDEVKAPRSESSFWAAGGAELWLRFPASGSWFAAVSAELLLPILRQRFVLEDGTLVYELPRLTGAAGVSFGVRLP